MAPTVKVRPAGPDDAARLLEWRNDAASIAASLTAIPVDDDEHARWFAQLLADPSRVLLIGEADGEPIGMCRFDVEGAIAEVSINLDPARREQGLAGPLLHSAIAALSSGLEVTRLTAQVRADNPASVRLFTAAGFVPDGDDILLFIRELSGTDPS